MKWPETQKRPHTSRCGRRTPSLGVLLLCMAVQRPAASIVVTITVTDEDDPAVITIHEGESDDGP